MVESDRIKFYEILSGLSEYYNKTISKIVGDIYFNGLKSLTIEGFKKSVDSVVQSRKYTNFPMIADFLEAVNPPEKTEMLILKAMTTFKKAITKYGYTKSFHFKDTVLSNLIQSVYGGWYAVLNERHNLKDDELYWWDKKFEANYRIFLKQGIPKNNPKMVGWLEVTNTSKGYACLPDGNPIKKEDGDWLMLPEREIKEIYHEPQKLIQEEK